MSSPSSGNRLCPLVSETAALLRPGPSYAARPGHRCPKGGRAIRPHRRSSDNGSPSWKPRQGLRRMDTLRVLVADDHRLMLAAIRRALGDANGFEIVGEVSVGSHVVPAVRETTP